MEQLKTVGDVIDSLGGVYKTASTLKQNPSTVSNWKARKRIPPKHFPIVNSVLKTIGKSAALVVFGMAGAGRNTERGGGNVTAPRP